MKSVFNWSGGKDSALCLHKVLQEGTYKIETLLTTLSQTHHRITMHGVRQDLLEQQAKSIGIPLQKLYMPEGASMAAYNQLMQAAFEMHRTQGVTHAIFGDINLEDLRQYREKELQKVSIEAVFPLWGKPTPELVREFIQLGYKAVVVAVNARLLDSSFTGRELDEQFILDLPENVDPCGENGEFHTFVYDGPIFKEPIKFELGERVLKTYGATANENDNCFDKEAKPNYDTGFWFCDLLPA
ncbi:diphthine--ammonia ligase [Pontibacter harenae]|uniref:Dph6-related ATP pyrophosphatase n=1 Tax=Pontibacter harenae TaxID=2894083 RepID=UPI001E3340E5|nr:diphthine--ammonia ligase [Pontibacter harenae]MCC9165759.1 diphthine--ammonia ligase [Pontibacter harenae]